MSVPADREMELGMEDFRCVVSFETRSRVSETVVMEGVDARPWISASMAAMGIVRSGSSVRRRL